MKKHFPTYIHETCTAFPYIYISAGIRGLQIKIAADDLIKRNESRDLFPFHRINMPKRVTFVALFFQID